jgi:hypothetical protein
VTQLSIMSQVPLIIFGWQSMLQLIRIRLSSLRQDHRKLQLLGIMLFGQDKKQSESSMPSTLSMMFHREAHG